MRGSGIATDPYLIDSPQDLQDINLDSAHRSAWYILAKDLDMSGFGNFTPIGHNNGVVNDDSFSGDFDGRGHTISNLTINVASGVKHWGVGLFGEVHDAGAGTTRRIRDVGLVNCSITASNPSDWNLFVGGLIGYTWAIVGTVIVERCFTTGTITVNGSASNVMQVGGFGGYLNTIQILNCYSRASVGGTPGAGSKKFGGFAGQLYTDIISYCYSTGVVNPATGSINGFGGDATGNTITGCFWDTETSGVATSEIGVGHTTAWMKLLANFTAAGYDFTTIWSIVSSQNNGYPLLLGFAAATPGEGAGRFAVVQTRWHYWDAYGNERYIEGTLV